MTIVQTRTPVDLRAVLSRTQRRDFTDKAEGEPGVLNLAKVLDRIYVTRPDRRPAWADFDWVVEDVQSGARGDFADWANDAVENLRAAFWAQVMNGKLEHTAEVLQNDGSVPDMDLVSLALPEAAGDRRDLALTHFPGEDWNVNISIHADTCTPAQLRDIGMQMLKLSFAADLLSEASDNG